MILGMVGMGSQQNTPFRSIRAIDTDLRTMTRESKQFMKSESVLCCVLTCLGCRVSCFRTKTRCPSMAKCPGGNDDWPYLYHLMGVVVDLAEQCYSTE